jgi:signal transduction histidine kinase
LSFYRRHYPNPVPEIQAEAEAIDLDFLSEDLPKLMDSMQMGAERIRQIVLSLRNFSRRDQAASERVDLHQGIDNTLLLLQHRLKAKAGHPEIQVIKEYGDLPLVECYAGQVNQVFMNILSNAIDALEEARSTTQEEQETDSSLKLRDASSCEAELTFAIAIADAPDSHRITRWQYSSDPYCRQRAWNTAS